MENLNSFELAGYSKEESNELIRICHECMVPYDVVLGALRCFKNPKDIEKLIREYNSMGY